MLKVNWEVLDVLCKGSDRQIDQKMIDIIKDLRGKPVEEVKAGLHKALDWGARYALASSFTMVVLDGEWKRLGGKVTDPTPWREEIEKAGG